VTAEESADGHEEQLGIPPIDLTVEEPTATAKPKVGYSQVLAEHGQHARMFIARTLIIVLAIVVIGSTALVAYFPQREPALESYLKLVFTPLVTLVSSVIGFYFGSHQSPD